LVKYILGIGVAALLSGCGASSPPVAKQNGISLAAAVPPPRSLRALYSFQGNPDGEQPNSNVVAPKHALGFPQIVGTTEFGGYSGEGTVYGLTKTANGTWTEKLLYQLDGADGWRPNGIAVPGVLDRSHPVFVTSFAGGKSSDGVVAVLRPRASGAWTLLSSHSFTGHLDGAAPFGLVVADQQGNVYGTTASGGLQNDGTVYRMHPNGSSYTESILYSFHGGSDGDYPVAGLTIDGNGALYGTTEYGGGSFQNGTVFKLTPSGSKYIESVLYAFKGGSDGSQPMASLCRSQTGTLYGTTSLGGVKNEGTLFKLTPSGSGYTKSILWQFGVAVGDGTYPEANVLLDTHGVLYGTTITGGSGSGTGGVLFTLKAPHRESVYDFDGYNGAGPAAGPAADSKGRLFIPTGSGGQHRFGTVAEAPITAGASACQ
jgi:uncharacterized repeat protein (TIGR03803 family)